MRGDEGSHFSSHAAFISPPPLPLSAPPARPHPRTPPHFFEPLRDFRLGFRQPPPSDLFDPVLVKFMSGRCSSRLFPESALATFPTFSLSIFGSQLLAISRPCPFCLSSPPSEVCRALIRPQTRGRFPDQPSRHCFQRAWPTLVLSKWPLTSRFFPFFRFVRTRLCATRELRIQNTYRVRTRSAATRSSSPRFFATEPLYVTRINAPCPFNIYARAYEPASSRGRINRRMSVLVVIISGGDATAIVILHRYVTELIFHRDPASSFN